MAAAIQSPVSLAEGPSRTNTQLSDEAIPDTDPGNAAGLLAERLQAWRHATVYLQDYVEAIEKLHKSQGKEYEKALKTISKPLKEGHHFDQKLGGVAGFFENMRTNTQSLIGTNYETEKLLKGSILPILERLEKEIKHKTKELSSGALKGAKEVDKVRNITQRHIELLGQQTAAFEASGAKASATEDPYVVLRGVLHRLHKQVIEENNYRNDLVAVQNNFQAFESHVIEVAQQTMEAFNQLVGGQADKTRALYADMLGAAQRIPPDFEWKGFLARNADVLEDPDEEPRSVETIQFPNMDHSAAKPLIEGTLERKSRNKLSFGYQTSYYVVTPSKFLHEFPDNDNTRKDPTPELSIYLPDALIGTPMGDKFQVKGKDRSKTLGSKLAGNSELSFKAHSAAEAQKWFDVIRMVVGNTSPAAGAGEALSVVAATDSPISPASEKGKEVVPPAMTDAAHKPQEEGVVGEAGPAAAANTAVSARDEKKEVAAEDAKAEAASSAAAAAVERAATTITADEKKSAS